MGIFPERSPARRNTEIEHAFEWFEHWWKHHHRQPASPFLRRIEMTQHGIQLAWTDGDPGATFNVYRGASAGGEDYTKPLVEVPAGTFDYLDTTVVSGTQYFYTVTAVVGGVESAPSNEASATAITVPASPTGLTATAQ